MAISRRELHWVDIVTIVVYFIVSLSVGLWVSCFQSLIEVYLLKSTGIPN